MKPSTRVAVIGIPILSRKALFHGENFGSATEKGGGGELGSVPRAPSSRGTRTRYYHVRIYIQM